ncbi:MAG: RES domain-containing protein [Balneolaceae bacterium]|nr:MAG: RES domain-containing protein [Balneolaceae bacterium]
MKQIRAWRMTKPEYANSALSGLGARQFGGRFNSPGHAVFYTSGSISLCMLEMLVQVNKQKRLDSFICTGISFDESLVEWRPAGSLPNGWDDLPYTRVSCETGDEWLNSGRTAVLAVPSVVVPQEWNYLLNPVHPDFKSLKVSESTFTPFDRRLLNRLQV